MNIQELQKQIIDKQLNNLEIQYVEEYKQMLDKLNKTKDINRIKVINERLIALQEIIL